MPAATMHAEAAAGASSCDTPRYHSPPEVRTPYKKSCHRKRGGGDESAGGGWHLHAPVRMR